MSLTKEDIQMIEEIIRVKVKKNLDKYVFSKPHVLKITYDELEKELMEITENSPDIPIVRIEDSTL